MNLLPWRRRSFPAQQFWDTFAYNSVPYQLLPSFTWTQTGREQVDESFVGFTDQLYKANGVVFACMAVRSLLFQEARFQWRRYLNGRPQDLFGSSDLSLLENPWPNHKTRDLLARMLQDVDLAGNFYAVARGGQIRRLRPDWVTIVLGLPGEADDPASANDLDAELLGYIYQPGGRQMTGPPVPLRPEEVAHFAPDPDPVASHRGMSWLTPVIREVISDSGMTEHKLKYLENGATPNLAVKLDVPGNKQEVFDEWVRTFREQHEGPSNAYRTLVMGAGADFTVVGSDLQQVDFKTVQGAGETRIAAAAGVPPVIVGLSEGLAAATYSNYQLAMRRFGDLTMRPLWGSAADALSVLITAPAGAQLDYDARHIPALAESERDLAEIRQRNAGSILTLVNSGFDPKTVVPAVVNDDLTLLEHLGLPTVQVQPPPGLPGTPTAAASPQGTAPAAAANGSQPEPQPAPA